MSERQGIVGSRAALACRGFVGQGQAVGTSVASAEHCGVNRVLGSRGMAWFKGPCVARLVQFERTRWLAGPKTYNFSLERTDWLPAPSARQPAAQLGRYTS